MKSHIKYCQPSLLTFLTCIAFSPKDTNYMDAPTSWLQPKYNQSEQQSNPRLKWKTHLNYFYILMILNHILPCMYKMTSLHNQICHSSLLCELSFSNNNWFLMYLDILSKESWQLSWVLSIETIAHYEGTINHSTNILSNWSLKDN